MGIGGVGGNTATTFPSTTERGQIKAGENKVEKQESKELINQKIKIEEARNVEDKKYSEEEAIKLIERANNKFVIYDRKFEFSIHEKTKQIMVKILDSTTDEVIKELPPEKVLDIIAGIWEVAGIMVDEKI